MRLPRPKTSATARAAGLVIILAACAAVVACGKRDTAPPPLTPAVAAPVPEPPRIPLAPVSEPQTVATLPPPQPIPPEAIPDVPPPLAVDPPRQTTELEAESAEVSEASSESVTPSESVAPAPPSGLRLGRILSPEERNEYNRSIDGSLAAAHRSLARVLQRGPNPEQTEEVKRVRAFIRQAETARKQDLPLAENLAERAKLLAEDLARSVQ